MTNQQLIARAARARPRPSLRHVTRAPAGKPPAHHPPASRHVPPESDW